MKELRRRIGRLGRSSVAIVAGVALVLSSSSPVRAASSHQQIQGSGSSWAFNAVNQWISDATQEGLQVVFTPSGSAQGRQDFAQSVTDFAVSDIGYLGNNPQTGQNDVSNRSYAYLPIVAGGTAFPYHLDVGGKRVENLRLSQLTLAKIFTDQITNWSDPEITHDNNGRALPSIPIIPVVHSEGAGTTYQFTQWLDTEFPSLWASFTKQVNQGQAFTYPVEYWPTGAGNQVAENGSDGVMNFVTSSAGEGSIGYDEYSYAIFANYPVAALENSDGWFTMPDAYDVAVSLTQAQIDYTPGPDYLLETLNNVYTFKDARDYPLSSYSYMIEPTGPSDPSVATTPKAQTLADFVNHSICQGQAEMVPIGYSPLPINLVERSYQQISLLHKANPGVNISAENVAQCGNPTFTPGQPNNNYLAKIAPYPPSCAQAGHGPCAGQYAFNGNPVAGHATGFGITGRSPGNPGGSSASGSTSVGGSSSNGSGGSNSSGNAAGGGGTSGGNSPTGGKVGRGTTGYTQAGQTTASSGPTQTTSTPVNAIATELGSAHPAYGTAAIAGEVGAAVVLLLALALPALLRRRREGS